MGLTHVGPKKHVLHGGPDPQWKGVIFDGCPARYKAFSAAMYPAKGITESSITACSDRGHSIVNNGTTRDADFCQNSLTSC